MPETIITNMAKWVYKLNSDQIPKRVKDKALLQVFSVFAAIHASARHDIGKIIINSVESWAKNGQCTMLPLGKKVDVLSAVYCNAALSLALDYDDYLLLGHTGHSAVSVSLAMAEKENSSFEEAQTAQIIANEIAGRLGASVVIGPHNGQAWSHIHLAGAAAAAGRLMGLTAEKIAHAIAIALYQPTYVLFPGFMGPDSKATTAATPAVTGVQAAILAANGATGPLDIMEHPQGFLARFSYVPTSFYISGFGEAWVTDTLAYKIYPGCAYIDTTVDAVLKLREDFKERTGTDFNPDDVLEVLVEASLLTIEMDHLSKVGGAFDPLNPVSINFSIPGNIAIALLKGRLNADDLSVNALQENSDDIIRLSKKVRLVHDWALTMTFLKEMNKVLKVHHVLREIRRNGYLNVKSKMQENYQSSILSFSDVKEIIAVIREKRWKVLKGISRGLLSILPFIRADKQKGYNLGDQNMEHFTMPFASRVTINMKGNISMCFQQDIPWGGPGHDFEITKQYVKDKFVKEAGENLSKEKLDNVLILADGRKSMLTVDQLMLNASFN